MAKIKRNLILWIKELDLRTRILIFAIILLGIINAVTSIGALVIAARVDNNSNKISEVERADFSRLREQALGFCHRLQTLRDRANNNSRIVYVVLKGSAKLTWETANNPDQPLTNKEREQRKEIARQYAKLASTSAFVPPTNCKKAVDNPLTYKAGKPIPYPEVELK